MTQFSPFAQGPMQPPMQQNTQQPVTPMQPPGVSTRPFVRPGNLTWNQGQLPEPKAEAKLG